ncbi:hypothetical protein EC973_004089 [Apophysomyces ossiformis]|uniref:Uncharacterized protein n=1 Tax=Apophysomyces ossiformis TaxID=679940 RepID=A0A8H7BLP9_9FUNG|nr:hypothetical protein EC973_004089 [Apophysomyces ossiformis]
MKIAVFAVSLVLALGAANVAPAEDATTENDDISIDIYGHVGRKPGSMDGPQGPLTQNQIDEICGHCGRCGEKAVNKKCCRGNLHDDGYCWCRKTGVTCPGLEVLSADKHWCLAPIPGKTCSGPGGNTTKMDCCYGGANRKGLCYMQLPTKSPDELHEICKVGGACGDKAVYGRCARGKLHDDGLCWCAQKGGWCPAGEVKRGGGRDWCVAAKPGINCGATGKDPIHGECCNNRGTNNDKKCVGGILPQCKHDVDCPNYSYVCCRRSSNFCATWKGSWRETCGS